MILVLGQAYLLSNLVQEMWTSGHKLYGTPDQLAGVYLGSIEGARRWHAFEIWVGGEEQGVIFMTQADLEQIDIQAVS